jgi:hypothetical protein
MRNKKFCREERENRGEKQSKRGETREWEKTIES